MIKMIGMALTLCPIVFIVGCTPKGQVTPQTSQIVVDRSATVPSGTVRYCWEEPMVQYEPNGPGVDTDGRWYHPSYLAVRQVRQGRWRPCRPVPSEVKGETQNER